MTEPTPVVGLGFLLAEDNALKSVLQGITVTDEKNNSRPVGVWFANPDVESRQQSYPYLTIELININWANYRQHSGLLVDTDLQGTVEPEEDFLYRYEMPVAWDLMYQITSYSRHPRHDRAITSYILSKLFRANRGFLPVYNELGTEYSWRHMILEDFAKRDMIEDGRRLFRNVFTVSVTSESVSEVAGRPSPVAQEVLINNDPNYIPGDLLQP